MHSKRLISGREALAKGRKELGQVQILAIFLFLLLIPTTVIIAQNSTINSTFTGDIIEETPEIPIINETEPLLDTENGTTDTIEESVDVTIEDNTTEVNETQENPPENVTQETNETINQTQENETIEIPSNYTNETEASENVTIPDELNQTANETGINETLEPEPVIPEINETINETEKAKPILDVGIISPDKVTRGEPFEINAYAISMGSALAKDVSIEWILPDGFVILSGSGSIDCQEVAPQTSCWNNITAAASLSSNLGLNDLKTRVSYSE
ncbi:MAG: hypothetical protein KAU24_02610 [Candidatus Aenigmarchaeota archaeon]|nr:hypothetical protein [Candidatus Aenigmarchaeota archaeon]